MDEILKELKIYAKLNNVPIIEDEGLEILLRYVKKIQPLKILEIGTAIGYSALCMAEVCNGHILTFEREEEMIKEAKKNIKSAKKEAQISIIENDFFSYDLGNEIFDFIYVDGAKAQYYNFFKKFKNNMDDNTIVLFDNLSFHGYVGNEEKKQKASKNLKQLIRKLENFNQNIILEPGYIFEYIEKGDGIGILKKEKNVSFNSNS